MNIVAGGKGILRLMTVLLVAVVSGTAVLGCVNWRGRRRLERRIDNLHGRVAEIEAIQADLVELSDSLGDMRRRRDVHAVPLAALVIVIAPLLLLAAGKAPRQAAAAMPAGPAPAMMAELEAFPRDTAKSEHGMPPVHEPETVRSRDVINDGLVVEPGSDEIALPQDSEAVRAVTIRPAAATTTATPTESEPAPLSDDQTCGPVVGLARPLLMKLNRLL